jgi:predicted component of type VI protein secretion system
MTSRKKLEMTFLKTQELSEDLEHNVRKLREFFHLHIKLQLNVKHFVKEKITIPPSQEPNSKNSAWISSENVFHQ